MGDELTETDKTQDWIDFLKLRYKKQLGQIGREYPHLRSLVIDYREVEKAGTVGIELADEILENPGKVIEDIREAIKTATLIHLKLERDYDHLNIRFSGVGKKRLLRDLRYDDVNKIVSIESALISRDTEVRPRVTEAIFRCASGHFTKKEQTSHSKFVEPDGCATDGCNLKKLEFISKRSKFTNQQKLRIQENSDGLKPGQQPQTMDVIVLDDICDQLYSGDRATINAIVRASQRVIKGEKSTVFDLFLELSSVEKAERDFEEIAYTEEEETKIKEIAKSGDALELISRSIAPTIWGFPEVKKAIALQMFGGVTKSHEDGQTTRGEIHILLLGDYGIAKSQLAKYACKQSPRGVFISAVSASGPGLIGAATKDDDGRWVVDAGSLPLADKGIAGIDEIDKADKDTLNCLYNVMEDGEVQISKAAKRLLKARTSIIACGNPKYQKFDPFADIIDQVTIPPALFNRFDLTFILMDTKVNDTNISDHILKSNYYGECKAAGKTDKISDEEKKDIVPPIPPLLLKKYIAYAKNAVQPIMNTAVRQRIGQYYVKVRKDVPDDSAAPITPRQIQSVIRLSEAMARMRLSAEVTLKDADAALEIFDMCIKSIATDKKTGKIDMGKLGQGLSANKKNLIGTIKECVTNEPRISLSLLIAKLEERSYKNENEIREVVKEMVKNGDLMEPKFERYMVM